MRKPIFLIILLTCVGLTGTARANECEDAVEAALQTRQWGDALSLCRKAAEQGDAEAQAKLGYMY